MSQDNKPVVVGVGAVVFQDNAVLLVKRKNPPNANEWAIPGGRIKPGETLQQSAEREILEETGITIRAGNPVFSFDLIERDTHKKLLFHYVIIDLEAEYIEGTPRASDDALDAAWIKRDQATSLVINPTTKRLLSDKYHFIF